VIGEPPDDEWKEADSFLAGHAERDASIPDYRDTLLPEGQVVRAMFRSVDHHVMDGTHKWYVIFDLYGSDALATGKVILRVYRVPEVGSHFARNKNLYIDFRRVVHELRKPPTLTRRCVEHPRGYLASWLQGVMVEAVTTRVTTTMKDRKKVETPPELWYSRIDRITSRLAGTPRIVQRRGSRR
jgi:hypothetical protein